MIKCRGCEHIDVLDYKEPCRSCLLERSDAAMLKAIGTDDKILAKRIYEIEMSAIVQTRVMWELTKDVCMMLSRDGICWYLWKRNPVSSKWDSFKVIPKLKYTEDGIIHLLKNQQWVSE